MADRSTPVYESGEADRIPAREHEVYNAIAQESDFVELRRRYFSFTVPATIAFMAWYIVYIVCNNWARDFMGTKVVGNINVALVFGLLQFVSTFVIAWLYAGSPTRSSTRWPRLTREIERSTAMSALCWCR